MKFSVSSSDITKALAKASTVVPTKSTMPILENFLFDLLNNTLTITATDLEVSLTLTLQVKGIEDGRIAVPSKRLLETVRSLPESEPVFDIDTTTNKIKVSTENGEYNLTGESAKDFPAIQQFKGTEQIGIDNSSLKKIIHRTVFAVSSDELRPAMMGVLLQPKGRELCAVSTDGHRLVRVVNQMQSSLALKNDIIVPAKALSIVNRSLEAGSSTVAVNPTHISFMFDSTVLVSRLIDEHYPNYESVIPKDNDKVMKVNRESTVAAIRRVGLYASAATHQIRFAISKGLLVVTAQDIDFGGEARESIPCSYEGDDLEIGFNSTYLLDVLNHLDSEEVEFRFSNPTRAGIVMPVGKQENEDVVMLVMPVRLNS